MISYEVPLILSLLGVIMLAGSLSFQDVVESQSGGFWHWYFLPQLPMFITFYIAGVAEARGCPSTCRRARARSSAGSWSSTRG
jgi:NADH-quinone oxidoreductase subunit H